MSQAANRILRERTGLENIYLEQFRVFGHENRILESQFRSYLLTYLTQKHGETTAEWMLSRFICIGFYALVDIHKVSPQRAIWMNI
ncbi:MAG: hypothetical protein R2822_09310 [Spirosomataceae bacterium]